MRADGRSVQPQPYAGLGSYVKATRLAEPAGAVFIEYHVVFAEPQGWFHGANLLRSKLPIVAQDMVRKFRRKMAEQLDQLDRSVSAIGNRAHRQAGYAAPIMAIKSATANAFADRSQRDIALNEPRRLVANA